MISLTIENNLLRDSDGRLVVVLESSISSVRQHLYANLFANSFELLDHIENMLEPILSKYNAFQYNRGSTAHPYIYSPQQKMPEWIIRGIDAVAIAKGLKSADSSPHPDVDAILRPLTAVANTLIDDQGTKIAELRQGLKEDDAQNYKNIFVASIPLLQILDTKSTQELNELKKDYEDAKEFSDHRNYDSPDMQPDTQPILPERLEEMLRLTAKAKGETYKAPF